MLLMRLNSSPDITPIKFKVLICAFLELENYNMNTLNVENIAAARL